MIGLMARLADLLINERILSHSQLDGLLQQLKDHPSYTRLGPLLIENNFFTDEQWTLFLARHYTVTPVDLGSFEISDEMRHLLPQNLLERYGVVPLMRMGDTLVLGMVDPSHLFVLDDIKFQTGYHIYPVVCGEKAFVVKIQSSSTEAHLSSSKNPSEVFDAGDVVKDEETQEEAQSEHVISIGQSNKDAPVVRLVHGILLEAIQKGASDIHVEPYEKSLRVRYRIDGSLYEVMRPALSLKNALVSRIKVMSRMDIAEKRLPQDGRIKVKVSENREIDFRVSVVPTLFGEKAVLRLLDKSNLQLDMTKLGFEKETLEVFKKGIYKPYGMVLVTGPTGSGKTTTLYSALAELNKTTENISTAEDPVEFNLPGINQVQMHNDIGLNFSSALRSFLRQDPDIIMVGEIRDFETAEIAIKAALTGHLVLSTLHTNDAPSTVVRLKNMGIEPFLLTASLNTVVAQRLVKKICQECKKQTPVSKEVLISAQVSPSQAEAVVCYEGAGCQMCGNTGYKGRIALYEILDITEHIKDLIQQGVDAQKLKDAAIQQGMVTLRRAALQKMIQGQTTLKEVIRVTPGD
jgi:type IV pilus assembly protein PilB